MNIFNNTSFVSIQKALDAAQLRQEVISNNITNATTPGYKKSIVKFEEYLEKELKNNTIKGYRTNSLHIPIGNSGLNQLTPKVSIYKDTFINNNKNNVDIDEEMTNLAKNQIYYDALAQNISGKFQKLKTVIGGGR